ncbi:MAG: hypothetical protein IIC24_07385, partial [Chloroflexi bacterium]|nr:hypothetical protein [Chloroflexota bacterium]
MAESKQFSYEGLFAKNAPMPRAGGGGAARRGKYDFAVAYPDPDSIPFDGLMEGLRQGLEEEGRDLALYAPAQGYGPLREFIAEKMARDRDIHVTVDDIIIGGGSDIQARIIMSGANGYLKIQARMLGLNEDGSCAKDRKGNTVFHA